MMHCDSNELKSSSVSNLHSNILFWVASLQCVQYVTQTGLWSLVLVFMCHSRLSALDSPCSLWKGLNFSPGKTEQMCQFLFKSHTHTHTHGKTNPLIVFTWKMENWILVLYFIILIVSLSAGYRLWRKSFTASVQKITLVQKKPLNNMIIKQGIIVSLTVFNLQAAECRCKSWFVWKWCSAETATLLFSRQAFLVLVYRYYFFSHKIDSL